MRQYSELRVNLILQALQAENEWIWLKHERVNEREAGKLLGKSRARKRKTNCSTILSNGNKPKYFHNNRYPTIPLVAYVTIILLIVCICGVVPGWGICTLFKTSLWGFGMNPPAPSWGSRAVSNAPSQPPGTTRCTAFAFNACECTAVHTCGERSFSPLHIS